MTRQPPQTPGSTPPPRKAAAKKAAPAQTRRTATPRLRRGAGKVEAAVFYELKGLGLLGSAMSTAAIAMARNIDEAQTAAGAAAASRELRQTLMLSRALGNPLSPAAQSGGSAGGGQDGEPGDGAVVPPSRLQELREAAGARTRR